MPPLLVQSFFYLITRDFSFRINLFENRVTQNHYVTGVHLGKPLHARNNPLNTHTE